MEVIVALSELPVVAKILAHLNLVEAFRIAAKLKIEGPCHDEVQYGNKIVPFRSWAGVYVACKLPPLTCTCPGQTWITDL